MTDVGESEQTLRAATREARETIKDMLDVMAQFDAKVVEARKLAANWRREYEESLKAEWMKGLEEYHKSLAAAIEAATDRLNKRMDLIAMMITKPIQTPMGPKSLEELVALKTGNALMFPPTQEVALGLPVPSEASRIQQERSRTRKKRKR